MFMAFVGYTSFLRIHIFTNVKDYLFNSFQNYPDYTSGFLL